jgi:hypothetical protein
MMAPSPAAANGLAAGRRSECGPTRAGGCAGRGIHSCRKSEGMQHSSPVGTDALIVQHGPGAAVDRAEAAIAKILGDSEHASCAQIGAPLVARASAQHCRRCQYPHESHQRRIPARPRSRQPSGQATVDERRIAPAAARFGQGLEDVFRRGEGREGSWSSEGVASSSLSRNRRLARPSGAFSGRGRAQQGRREAGPQLAPGKGQTR